MKWIQKVETFDGQHHDDYLKAERHLDKLFGNVMNKIGHGLVQCDGKYTRLIEWVEANLGLFIQLDKIKQDMVLIPVNED